MNTNNIQQKHIYNERVQEFFPLFDEIKKEDDLIYNVRVDFNTVKFLTEHADWNWDEDENKNKACGVILQECNKTARKELEDKAKEELNKYITSANNINDDVEDKKVSIYGNHASITLEDNKKEFKISEFLNSDFCQKNGISGFSTLHSDGKSGMHGFVAEEGGKKIRHYVVTDGSYEMTLKWYAKGEECKIKIKIDANGVDLVKGDDFSLERLEANQDVKIGGLFLHEIKFREKGKVNEVQHDGKDNQALNKSSEIAIKSNSRDIEQEVKKPVQKHQATHMNREIGSQTPSLPPLRTTPEKDVFNEQGSGSQKPDRSEQTPNNQQKGATSDPSDSSTFTKSVSHNQDNRQKDERYDNPTFGHAVPGSQKPDRSEQTPNNQQQPKTQQQEGNSKGDLLQDIRNFKRNSLRRTGVVDGSGASMEGGRKNESTSSILETLKDKVPYLPYSNIHEHDSDNRGASDAEWEESKQPLSVPKPNSKSDSGYSPQIHAQPQVDPEQPKRSLENIEQSDQTPPENLLKEIRDRSQQDNRGLRQVDPTDKLSQDKEDGLLKDSSTDVKTNDSGYSPQIHAQPQVDPEQPKRSLENIEQSDQTPPENLLKEIRDRSQQDNRGLRQVDPTDKLSQDKEDGLLKDSSTDVKTNDSGYSPQIHAQPQVDPEQPKRSLENIEQSDQTPPENLLKEIRDRSQQDNRGLRQVDPTDKLSQDKEDGLLKDSSTDAKTNDSGYSSPTHANHGQSQVNPGQLKASLMNVEQRDDTLLTEFISKLDKETQKFPLKPVDQKGISEQTKEHLLAAGLLKDSSTDIKTVAEQENNDTNSIVDKNSNLYKLLEKDEAQLKIGVIEEERKDTLTEHTDSYDRNRIALGNRNKRPLDWTKRIAESQQEKDTNKGISI
ncbi:hypothetical protein NMD99_02115 [Wolbachia endosymbiont of Listronotus oregonensis]|uniref:hypothetical protein n=1 Tax=Wolbachia endosymbiont of Listronotus oregonensis TaxID=2969106 RepID=UPI0028160427|nr:hypothetical protein [Wolbachia endosymbiont of Listronotus oregonensis]WMT84809.1 hypothetical protein NMD99_02115 [Wolbachia endosymbiont of Listronotus oregonensis]